MTSPKKVSTWFNDNIAIKSDHLGVSWRLLKEEHGVRLWVPNLVLKLETEIQAIETRTPLSPLRNFTFIIRVNETVDLKGHY